jgi:iron complex transport system substrate-binding protein
MFRKVGIIILAVAIFAGLAASCGKTKNTTSATSTVITDQLGQTITLTTTNPQRIISLAPSNTEILYALGLGDRIVGVTDFDNYPPEVKNKPSVGGYTNPNIEKIIAMQPDLILGTEAQSVNTYQQLESKGLTVVALSPKTLDDVLASITLVGKITGKDKEAAQLTASMQKRIKAVTDRTSKLSPDTKPRVFYIIWNDPLMTAGKGTFIDELINKAGGINIAGNLESYPTISLENVLTDNPQVIIAGAGMGEGEDLPYKYATTEPRLQGTDARKNNRVYSVNTDIVGRPGPRIVDALEDFLTDIHPELATSRK